MNPLAVVGIVAAVLAAAAGIEGKLLLDAHEKMGDLKVKIQERDGIIAQHEKDAALSSVLVSLQNMVEIKLKTVGNETRQGITNATTDDDAAAAARTGIMRLRSTTGRPGPATP